MEEDESPLASSTPTTSRKYTTEEKAPKPISTETYRHDMNQYK